MCVSDVPGSTIWAKERRWASQKPPLPSPPPFVSLSPSPFPPTSQQKKASPSSRLSPSTAVMVSSSSNKDAAAAAAFKEQMETLQERSAATMDLGPPAWLTRPYCLEGPLSVDEVSF